VASRAVTVAGSSVLGAGWCAVLLDSRAELVDVDRERLAGEGHRAGWKKRGAVGMGARSLGPCGADVAGLVFGADQRDCGDEHEYEHRSERECALTDAH